MLVDGCGGKNFKQQKCFDSTYHEKTSYAAILSGKDVIGDDYDVDNLRDFVNALHLDFMKTMRKMRRIV